MRRAAVDALRAPAELPIACSRPRLRADMQLASCQGRVHHRGQRRHQIPIALAAQPAPNFPRLRALALFGRRTAERAESLAIAGVQKTAQTRPSSDVRDTSVLTSI